jgi:hypothetical protein
MFIGHFALGFAAKRATPRVSLAILFLAAQFADVLWPFLVSAGVEQVRIDPGNTAVTPLDFVSYPYSHSLAALIVWATVLGAICHALVGGRTTFVVIAALVLSHWVFDFLTHRPDMPIYPGSAKYGLTLWNSLPATLAVELAMFVAGVWVYAMATRSRDAAGRWSFVALVAFLLIVYVGNLAGGPPPSIPAIYWAGTIGAVVILAWSWWMDRRRAIVPAHD